jgi:hypothetical protein
MTHQAPSEARTFRPWSADDLARLVTLGDELAASPALGKHRWPEIAREFPGRTWLSCRQQYSLRKRLARGHVEPPRGRERKANGRINRTGEERMQPPVPAGEQPRYASLSAALFGDPPIGRSALDQMKAALA